MAGIHQVADDAIEQYAERDQKGDMVFENISSRYLVPDLLNRDEERMSAQPVHDLIDDIATSGFKPKKAEGAIAIRAPADVLGSDMQFILDHCKRSFEDEDLLPNVVDHVVATLLSKNHLNMASRCFIYKVPATEVAKKKGLADSSGKLCLHALRKAQPKWADFVEKGPRILMLKASIRTEAPLLLSAIQGSENLEHRMEEHEFQLLRRARNRMLALDNPSEDAVSKVRAGLEAEFPQFRENIPDALRIVEVIGAASAPFLDDVSSAHSACRINPQNKRVELSWMRKVVDSFPDGCGWGIVAIIKMQLLCAKEDVKAGVCRALSHGDVSVFSKGEGVGWARQLHTTCHEFRTSADGVLKEFSAQQKNRILCRLDVLCARLAKNHIVSVPHPQKKASNLELKSFQAVRDFLHRELLEAAAKQHVDVEKHGLSPDAPDLDCLPGCCVKVDEKAAKKGAQAAVAWKPVAFDADGSFQGHMKALADMGVWPGSVIVALEDIRSSAGFVLKKDEGRILAVTHAGVQASWKHCGVNVLDADTFLAGKIAVTKLGGDEEVKSLEPGWDAHLPASSPAFGAVIAKAEVLCALGHLVHVHPSLTSDDVEVQKLPRKRVLAKHDMPMAARARVIVPVSTKLDVVDRAAGYDRGAIATSRVVRGSDGKKVVVILPDGPRVPGQKADDGKDGFVSVAWLMHFSSKREECNFELQEAAVHAVNAVRVPGCVLDSVEAECKLPVLVQIQDIRANTELVYYRPEVKKNTSKPVSKSAIQTALGKRKASQCL